MILYALLAVLWGPGRSALRFVASEMKLAFAAWKQPGGEWCGGLLWCGGVVQCGVKGWTKRMGVNDGRVEQSRRFGVDNMAGSGAEARCWMAASEVLRGRFGAFRGCSRAEQWGGILQGVRRSAFSGGLG